MKPNRIIPALAVVLALVLLAPLAGATIAGTGAVLEPAATTLQPLAVQTATVTIAIIPSGATTFQKGHSLQMQTDRS